MVVEETEDSPALTPEGNAALVDDFGGNKQLITVTHQGGQPFYILIDRANEDKETAVHFLNQVDDADLMALMEDGQTKENRPLSATARKNVKPVRSTPPARVCATDDRLYRQGTGAGNTGGTCGAWKKKELQD